MSDTTQAATAQGADPSATQEANKQPAFDETKMNQIVYAHLKRSIPDIAKAVAEQMKAAQPTQEVETEEAPVKGKKVNVKELEKESDAYNKRIEALESALKAADETIKMNALKERVSQAAKGKVVEGKLGALVLDTFVKSVKYDTDGDPYVEIPSKDGKRTPFALELGIDEWLKLDDNKDYRLPPKVVVTKQPALPGAQPSSIYSSGNKDLDTVLTALRPQTEESK